METLEARARVANLVWCYINHPEWLERIQHEEDSRSDMATGSGGVVASDNPCIDGKVLGVNQPEITEANQ